MSADKNIQHIVYCHDPSQDKWTTLPPLPVKWFGLGQINGNLVAVGGRSNDSYFETNKVYTYDEQAKTWKQTIPPMPTARCFPGVLSLQSALVVAGGSYEHLREPRLVDIFKVPFTGMANLQLLHTKFTDVVEIFKLDTLQWYKSNPLPTPCQIVSLIDIGNTCYALGGHNKESSYLHQALHASVDDLLRNAVPANQTTHSGSSDTQSAWKTLPNTPTYGTVAGKLGSNLLAMGISNNTTEIYMYVISTNSWVYIGALPSQECFNITVTNLSPLEVLVTAGSSVHKGTPFVFK